MPLVTLLISAIANGLFVFVLIPSLRRRALDYPNFRSSHQLPTPRGGGLSFVIVTALCSILASLFYGLLSNTCIWVLFSALPLAVVGFLDDRHGLSARFRFGVQIFTALMLIFVSPLTSFWLFLPFLVVGVAAVINFTNFMDGLDGLVAGCLTVTIAALLIPLAAPWPMWALVGSLLGFLFWNWSPAKVFMGDVGSTFLGSVFAGLVLQAASWTDAFGYLLVATPLLADAFFCVLRRFIAGQPVFQAHRLHVFQRLHQAGWPHSHVSFTYVLATTVLALAMLAGGLYWVLSFAFVVVLCGAWLDQRVAVPFSVASNS